MKVNIGSITEQKGASVHLVQKIDCPPLDQEINCRTPLSLDLTLTNTGDCILLRGKMETEIELPCDRCLQPTIIPLKMMITEEFYPAVDELKGQRRGEDDGEDEEFFAEKNHYFGESIDLTEVLTDNLLLGIPMKILCREDCLGFCPLCGQNLNEGSCQCEVDTIDPRLASLKALLNTDHDS
jgi:uncharacterized protein